MSHFPRPLRLRWQVGIRWQGRLPASQPHPHHLRPPCMACLWDRRPPCMASLWDRPQSFPEAHPLRLPVSLRVAPTRSEVILWRLMHLIMIPDLSPRYVKLYCIGNLFFFLVWVKADKDIRHSSPSVVPRLSGLPSYDSLRVPIPLLILSRGVGSLLL